MRTLLLLPGRGRWLRVLCQAPTGDTVLRTQLLRRVRQRRGHDECRRDANVFVPGQFLIVEFSVIQSDLTFTLLGIIST